MKRAWIPRILGLLIPFAIWEIASRTGLMHPVFLPPLSIVLLQVATLPLEAGADFLSTGFEMVVSLFLTGLSGVVIGVVLAQSERLDAFLGALMWFFYAAPLVVFTTFFIVVLGVGPGVPISLGILSGIVFVIASTRDGVREIGRDLVNVGRVFGANPLELALRIVIPAAVPMIMAGLRVGVGRVLVGVIVGEYFASGGGLGYLIVRYGNELDMVRVYAAVIWIVAASIALNTGFARIERSFVTWRPV